MKPVNLSIQVSTREFPVERLLGMHYVYDYNVARAMRLLGDQRWGWRSPVVFSLAAPSAAFNVIFAVAFSPRYQMCCDIV